MLSQAADGEGILVGEEFYNAQEKMIIVPMTISEYFTKGLVPINLSYLYPFPFQVGGQVKASFIVYPIMFMSIIISSFLIKWDKILLAALSFFLLHILLVSNLFSLSRFAITADRYAYISIIGIVVGISYALEKWQNHKKIFNVLALTSVIAFFAIHTFIRISDWKSTNTLKADFRQLIKNRN
jgi:hypothetical protein